MTVLATYDHTLQGECLSIWVAWTNTMWHRQWTFFCSDSQWFSSAYTKDLHYGRWCESISGPANYSVSVDDVAWYLYWWFVVPEQAEHTFAGQTLPTQKKRQEDDVVLVTGLRGLAGDYASVIVQDIVLSSLGAYEIAGYDYDNMTAYSRVKSALEGQWANPGAQGPRWEGTFTIPVCNVQHGDKCLPLSR